MPASTSFHEIDASLRHSLRFRVGLLGMGMLLLVAGLRFALGQAAIAWVDLGWAIGLAVAIAWLARGMPPSMVGLAMVVLSVACSCLKVMLLGPSGLFWLMPVVLGSFAVAAPGPAALLTGVGIACASIVTFRLQATESAVAFTVSAVLVLAIAWVSAAYVDSLRLRLEQLATRDALTGAGNRRALEQALRRLSGGDGHDALAVLDLDHFKQVNDRHGHVVGDRVLAEVAALVQQLLRPQDQLFRFGGEEFVVLMPGIGHADACGLLALVNAAVRQKVRIRQQPVTVSVGLAMWRPGESAAACMARADAALYRAKAAGRDRVVDAAAMEPAMEPAIDGGEPA